VVFDGFWVEDYEIIVSSYTFSIGGAGVGFELNDRWRCLHCTPANPSFFWFLRVGLLIDMWR